MCASCYSKDPLRMTAYVLVIVGALNWGLVGLFQLDLVHLILGFSSFLTRLVYILVGVSAVLLLAGKSECSCVHESSRSQTPTPATPPPPQSPPRAPEPPQPTHSSMEKPSASPPDSVPPTQPSAF